MEYTTLGKTELRVSKLGLGGAPIGGDFGAMTDQQAVEIIHEALDIGITFFDTAPLYGRGESERRFGKGLKGKRDQIVLATKAVQRDEKYSYENTIRCVEESLKRLQTDYIDLIQLHEAERTTFEEGMNGTVAAFLKLKEQGKVRAIGVNGGDVELLFPYIRSGHLDTCQTFSRYMLIDHTAKDELFLLAKQENVAIINGSPLGMGILADSPAPFLNKRHEILTEAEQRKAQLAFLRKPGPKGFIEPAMRFSLYSDDIAVTLTGASSVEILQENASYCDGVGLTDEERTKIYSLFHQKPLFRYPI